MIKNQPFLSLIIPSYKQEKTVVSNLKELIAALDKTRYTYEIIVVVDGQVDQTFKKLKSAELYNTSIYQYLENRGKSYAIRFGMKMAQGEHIMFLDAGNEIDPDGISMLLEHMKWYDADIIVGSKRHPVSRVNYTWQRKLLSYGYYYFVKLLFGVRVKDTQAGIKVFKRSVIKKVLPRLVEKRFAGDLEMLVVAKKLGFNRIYEAPIKLDYELGSLSSAATFTQIWKIFLDTLAIYYRKNILRYYDQVNHKTYLPDKIEKKVFPYKQ